MIELHELVYDQPRSTYRAHFRLDDVTVNTSYPTDVNESTAHELWGQSLLRVLSRWEDVLELIAKELLPVKNADWLDEGEAAMSDSSFKNALKLIQIDFDSNGAATLRFLAGDLFWGHWVVARFDLSPALPSRKGAIEIDVDLNLDYATIEG